MIKFAVVGMVPIGSMHIDNLRAGKINNAELACVCEQRPVDDPKYADVKIYKDIDEMLNAGGFDAVIISTPSFTHFGLGKKSLEAGYHTLIEKPIALCTADAIELQEIAKKCGKTCAIMLNQRTTPLYVRIKELIDNGEIGKINRISWTMSNWYRPDIYFSSSPWRGTWKGEAGGALINQSIHNIDIWAWAFGMPEKLRAWCKYGKYHDIEVEDAVFSFEDDASIEQVQLSSHRLANTQELIALKLRATKHLLSQKVASFLSQDSLEHRFQNIQQTLCICSARLIQKKLSNK